MLFHLGFHQFLTAGDYLKEVLFDLGRLQETLFVAVVEFEQLLERLVIELQLLETVSSVTPLNLVRRVLDLVAELFD